MARTLRLTLAYDGTDFHGWQYQPGLPTVQGLAAAACERILGAPTRLVGASRTDAGVHALRQVASLTTSSVIAPAALGRALNALLPLAIRVVDSREAPAGFDARRSARGKRYAYLIDRGAAANPFLRRYAWHLPLSLDPGAMRQALRLMRGKQDFSTFCAAPGRGRTPVCTIRSVRLAVWKTRLVVLVSADSFLHHMVRNLVGTLVEVGRGARRPEWVGELLEGRDRTRAGPTAPPQGLMLVRVIYPEWGAPTWPATPPSRSEAPRQSRGAPRHRDSFTDPEWGAPTWPPPPPSRSEAPRQGRGAPRHPDSFTDPEPT